MGREPYSESGLLQLQVASVRLMVVACAAARAPALESTAGSRAAAQRNASSRVMRLQASA